MRISEMFASIQGEGMLTGVPSLFIRTSGCNLRCKWCDTPYTSWRAEGGTRTVAEILDWVAGQPVYRHVVVTGGEPMLDASVVELCGGLKAAGLHVTIETAGTVYQGVECDLMSISPKLRNSTPEAAVDARWAVLHEETRIRMDVLRRLVQEYEHQLKFVVKSAEDMREVLELAEGLEVRPERVLLMPEGTAPESQLRAAEWVVEASKQYGFRYSPRLHVLIYGDRRGV